MLVESRYRFGGRIKTEVLDGGHYDMGPAWFWQGQPRMAKLIKRLDLSVFEQYDKGSFAFEDETGQVQYGRGFGSMQGAYRLKGGLHGLTDVLARVLPKTRKRLGAKVTALEKTQEGVLATLYNGKTIDAQKIVLALPPRVAEEQINFIPALSNKTTQAMQNIATWMAGQAKVVAVYDTPFWQDAGLSGGASSRLGPMVEIHDASPAQGGPYALFGFIGTVASARMDEVQLRSRLHAQLTRIFGPEAAKPRALFIKDWAFDTDTASLLDLALGLGHPQYGLPNSMHNLWDGALLFGGTEIATQFGGYLEGALEAAESVLNTLRNETS